MAVEQIWKIRLVILLSRTEDWLKNLFSSPATRAVHYRQTVDEVAFETWIDWGTSFEQYLRDRIADAESQEAARNIRFWRDVMETARSFDADPGNRRKRDAMTFHHDANREVVA